VREEAACFHRENNLETEWMGSAIVIYGKREKSRPPRETNRHRCESKCISVCVCAFLPAHTHIYRQAKHVYYKRRRDTSSISNIHGHSIIQEVLCECIWRFVVWGKLYVWMMRIKCKSGWSSSSVVLVIVLVEARAAGDDGRNKDAFCIYQNY